MQQSYQTIFVSIVFISVDENQRIYVHMKIKFLLKSRKLVSTYLHKFAICKEGDVYTARAKSVHVIRKSDNGQ